MKFTSGATFKARKNYAVSLMAMSGMGKTHVGRILAKNDWFHYSADYRIGTRYLVENILDNLKTRMMQDPVLRKLLLSDSFYLSHNLTVDNLELLANFIGKFGNPNQGGLPMNVFLTRQQLYADAEKQSQQDLLPFIEKAKEIYNYRNFLNDTTGSLCEIVDIENPNCPILKIICDCSLLLYVEADHAHEKIIHQRQIESPKPMYYNIDFFHQIRQEINDDNINPDDFLRIIFPRTMAFRKSRYQRIAQLHGYKVSGAEFAKIRNSDDFIDLIATAIDTANAS